MRTSISHPKDDPEGIRSRNPTKLLYLSPNTHDTRNITTLTGSSSVEELNRPGIPFYWLRKCNPYCRMTPMISAAYTRTQSQGVPESLKLMVTGDFPVWVKPAFWSVVVAVASAVALLVSKHVSLNINLTFH